MKDSHIQWTDHTFNPWEGCTKVSPGCLHCYAETRNKRFADGANWGKGAPRRRTVASNWRGPVQWNAEAQRAIEVFDNEAPNALDIGQSAAPSRPRVFCASLADWLDEEVPIEWLADLLVLIFDCGFIDWQLLTKRPENFRERLLAASREIAIREISERNAAIEKWIVDWVFGSPPHNVWIGVSVEDQTRADERIPQLLDIAAEVRFLSCEPLLGRISLGTCRGAGAFRIPTEAKFKACERGIDWVIIGGESGAEARGFDIDWTEAIIIECRAHGVPVFVKQLGAKPYSSGINGIKERHPDNAIHLKHAKGGEWDEWPERLRVREFPGGAS